MDCCCVLNKFFEIKLLVDDVYNYGCLQPDTSLC